MNKQQAIEKLKAIWINEDMPDNFGLPFLTTGQIMYGLGLRKNDHGAVVYHMASDQCGFIGTLINSGVVERLTDLNGYIGYQITPSYMSYFWSE